MEIDPAKFAQLMHDRIEIAETLHRYARALDHNDAALLTSAFAEDCVFDFTPAGKRLEIDFPVVRGRDAVVDALISIIGPLDTSHSISNLQIEVAGETAKAHAYVLSQHFMPGEGARRESENALLMNRYDATLARDGHRWRLQSVRIDNAWAEGNPTILTALATLRSIRAKAKK